MKTSISPLVLLSLLALGCGSTSEEPDPQAAAADASMDVQLFEPTDAGSSLDTVTGDAASSSQDTASSEDQAAICPGGAGCPCDANDDCDGGLCIEGGEGKRCAQPCVDSCDVGFRCAQVPQGSDLLTVCVDAWARLCSPCEASKECNHPGVTDARCVPSGDVGAHCGAACQSSSDCPASHACESVLDVDGNQVQQCVPVDAAGQAAACLCSNNTVSLAFKTACVQTVNQAGTELSCSGQAQCKAPGEPATCVAATPAAEACDGVDNDCDGQTDEQTCDDGNGCTTDACEPTSGCVNTALQDGIECDADGSVCTVSDACAGGVCAAGNPVDCDDGNPCTKDSCDLVAGCTQTVFDGVKCDDDNPCTVGDSCVGGQCQAGVAKTCTSNQPCVAGVCDLTNNGKCKFTNKPEGTVCDDDDICSLGEACKEGICASTQKKNCDDNNACTEDSCNPKTGCVQTNLGVGGVVVACDDGDACSEKDSCVNGVCGGSSVTCDDNNTCTVDTCDKVKGCVGTPVADQTPCVSGAGDSWCQAGKCVPKATIGDACTSGAGCASGFCVDGVCCESACVGGCLSCLGKYTGAADGKCKPSLPDTDPDNECNQMAPSTCGFTGLCDGTGKCAMYKPGTVCLAASCKGGVHTTAGVCGSSGCELGKSTLCDDSNSCTEDVCDAEKVCVHKETGMVCDDGDACTSGELCGSVGPTMVYTGPSPAGFGVCKGTPVKCDDGDPCTADSCDKATGCVKKTLADGTDCSADGSKWCQAGKCEVKAVCGNGKKEADEQCDDGNKVNGDTCTADCKLYCAKPKWDFTSTSQAAGWTFAKCQPGSSTTPVGCSTYTPNGSSQGWQIWTSAAYKKSSPGALYYGYVPSQNFNWGSSAGYARTPPMPVPAGATKLEFSIYNNTESGTTYDKTLVYLYVNGVQSGGAVYVKSSTSVWKTVSVNLAPHVGKSVQLLFYFNTVDSIANTGKGVFVDDVQLFAPCP